MPTRREELIQRLREIARVRPSIPQPPHPSHTIFNRGASTISKSFTSEDCDMLDEAAQMLEDDAAAMREATDQ